MDELVLLDFFTLRCGPCRMLAPILEKLQRVKVVKLNCDDPANHEAAMKHQVAYVPTLVLMRGETVLDKRTGLFSLQDLQALVDQHVGGTE